jgi:hypothetical protein
MSMSKWAQWTVLVSLVIALLLAGCCPIANNAPQITSLSADPAMVDPEADTTITCVATDADGDTLTYAWSYSGPAVGGISGTGSTVEWTVPETEGTYTVSVTVSDGKGGTDEGSCAVTVEVSVTTGSIDVKSDPAGATVYLDGADTGDITPYVLTDVDEGDHTLKLSKEYRKDRAETISVEAGETTYVNWDLDPAAPQTVTLQPDATEGKDTVVYSTDPAANEGDLEILAVGNNAGDKIRTYIRFELAGIPATAVVTWVGLLLWYGDSSDAVVTSVDAYQVTEAWAENTVTWDGQPAYGAAIGSTSLPDVETNDFVTWELEPGLVEGWIAGGTANNGLLLIDADEDTPGAVKAFASSDHPTENMRPKLVISYYDPAP